MQQDWQSAPTLLVCNQRLHQPAVRLKQFSEQLQQLLQVVWTSSYCKGPGTVHLEDVEALTQQLIQGQSMLTRRSVSCS